MNKKVKEMRKGIRLDIRKPPKTEIPKNIYNRKVKHKSGMDSDSSAPFFMLSYSRSAKVLTRLSAIIRMQRHKAL